MLQHNNTNLQKYHNLLGKILNASDNGGAEGTINYLLLNCKLT